MSQSGVRVPAELRHEFRRFRQDFEAVWEYWLERGEETAESRADAKEHARRWLSEVAEQPDGVPRIRQMFDFWSELAGRLCPRGDGMVSILPGLNEAEAQAVRERRGRR